MFSPHKALPVEKKDYKLGTILFRAAWLLAITTFGLFILFRVMSSPGPFMILC